MGLVKTGIKYGALYGIAKEGFKHLDKDGNPQQQPQQPSMQQGQYQQPPQYQHRDLQQPGPQHPQQQQRWKDQSGYNHQAYCNGQCGNRCNGGGAAESYFNNNNNGGK